MTPDRDGQISSQIRMPAELHRRLAEAAAERGLTVNFMMVKAIEEFLPRLIPPDEWRLTR